MYLKQLKLSGFKSFVEPTVVHFPSQLVAVVGPNGCGKSNIIDAVRWVMGESFAKNLRGECMTDVIFNGSSHCKPVGQASVELVVDNSLERLTGPFAAYAELAVKRVLTRDGESVYYLNGTRCRRKDITDIFLGTGVGARSYSIIGQGTISQLIEAKPEDLRIILEEAAGVSKYKERRRETLQRIAQTREHLSRVADIRDELEKQVQRLQRQAGIAEHYLALKSTEQQYRAEILALEWQNFTTQQARKQAELLDLLNRYEEEQSTLSKANKQRLILQEHLHVFEEQTQENQANFYQFATKIVRLEENIQQQERERKRLKQEEQQLQEDCCLAEVQFKKNEEQLSDCQKNTQALEAHLNRLSLEFKEQAKTLQDRKKEQAQWESYWKKVELETNCLKRDLELLRLKAQYIEEKKQQAVLKLEQLKLAEKSILLTDLQQSNQDLQEQRARLIAAQKLELLQLKKSQEHTEEWRGKLQEIEQQLHQLQDEFHGANSEHAALMAAQRTAKHGRRVPKQDIKSWSDKQRLIDILRVEAKWQVACEQVLNEGLHAYVLENFDELWPQRVVCAEQGEQVVTMRTWQADLQSYPRLADKIDGDIPAHTFPLEHIYAAEDFNQALSYLPTLAEYESVITPEGLWLGQGWAKFVNPAERDDLSLLARQEKIAGLSLLVSELQEKIDDLREQRDHAYQVLQKSLQDNQVWQFNLESSNESLRANTMALSIHDQSMLHAEQRAANLALEFSELQALLEECSLEQANLRKEIHGLEDQAREHQYQQEKCLNEKQEWSQALELLNTQMEKTRILLHHGELEYEREKNRKQQAVDRMKAEQARLIALQERLQHVACLYLQTADPVLELNHQLNQQLLRQSEVERHLILSREQLAQLHGELEELQKNILSSDVATKQMQELINLARMEEQALSMRTNLVEKSLNEMALQAQTLLEHIPVGTTQSMREEELMLLSEKIKNLGAINMAAIEELVSEQQRKTYLEEQYDDLCQALATLEAAMEQMDKETQLRLESTFSKVNTSFKSLFPRLFGGGRAQLELTCDNPLEAGIVVMAQPPGKRNSTIHLLSGGEKAMTAVALVFAVFQLNPSPFCMLDEVDAPLDEVNIGRFCALVREMSEFVQFLFITHNKATMELADHLIGVTMREPGVSRLVAVDVVQVLSME